MTFSEFLVEQEKRIKLFGLTGGEKRGGARQSSGKLMATGHPKVVNPYKPTGLTVPGEIFGKRKPTNIIGS